MKKKLFNELLNSVREGAAILKDRNVAQCKSYTCMYGEINPRDLLREYQKQFYDSSFQLIKEIKDDKKKENTLLERSQKEDRT